MKPEVIHPKAAANINAAPAQPKIDIEGLATKIAAACLSADGGREASS